MNDHQDKSSEDIKDNKEMRIDMKPISTFDGNWRTIDLDILYDTEKRHLTKCHLDEVYKILEYFKY